MATVGVADNPSLFRTSIWMDEPGPHWTKLWWPPAPPISRRAAASRRSIANLALDYIVGNCAGI
jgi:hypothetical protein